MNNNPQTIKNHNVSFFIYIVQIFFINFYDFLFIDISLSKENYFFKDK